MNCTDCRDVLNDFSDGELDSAAARAVEAHLEACVSCRTQWESLRTLRTATATLKKNLSPTRDLWPGIEAELARTAGSTGPAAVFAPRVSAIDRLLPWLLPLATAVVVFGIASFSSTHRRPGPAWNVASMAGTPRIGETTIGTAAQLHVGQWLETDAGSRAKVDVGSIGEVRVEPNSRLRLIDTGATNHRIELARGTMTALIWAPPRLFFVETPSATAIDLGCAYTLTVADDGGSILHVTSGYVALEHHGRESIIPAHMQCVTRPQLGPGTPFADDATESLRQALERFDLRPDPSALRDILAVARKDDAITLWHLLTRTAGAQRGAVFDALAAGSPPPDGVTRTGILAGNAEMRHTWGLALGLMAPMSTKPAR